MKIKQLGKEVSPFIIGTASNLFVNEPNPYIKYIDKDASYNVLDSLVERDYLTFDCAAHYGEECLSEYLLSRNLHEKAVIITKGCHPNKYRNRVTEFDLMSDIHDSLIKLKREYIDIYFLHRDDPGTPVEKIIPVLDRLHREGKIGVYGVSNWTVERIKEANLFAEQNGMQPFSVSSPNYSLAHQVEDPWGGGCVTITGEENEVDRQWYSEQEMPIFAYSALARGFFSGKFKHNQKEKADQVLDVFAKKGYMYDENFERLARVEILAEKYDCKIAQIALAWIFSQELLIAPIVSGSSINHYQDIIDAMDIKLSQEEIAWLDLRIN